MRSNCLYYYKDESMKRNEESSSGAIPLDHLLAVKIASEFGPSTFRVCTTDRDYVLRAESADSRRDWTFEFHRSIGNIARWIWKQKSKRGGRQRSGTNFSLGYLPVKHRTAGNRSSSLEFDYSIDNPPSHRELLMSPPRQINSNGVTVRDGLNLSPRLPTTFEALPSLAVSLSHDGAAHDGNCMYTDSPNRGRGGRYRSMSCQHSPESSFDDDFARYCEMHGRSNSDDGIETSQDQQEAESKSPVPEGPKSIPSHNTAKRDSGTSETDARVSDSDTSIDPAPAPVLELSASPPVSSGAYVPPHLRAKKKVATSTCDESAVTETYSTKDSKTTEEMTNLDHSTLGNDDAEVASSSVPSHETDEIAFNHHGGDDFVDGVGSPEPFEYGLTSVRGCRDRMEDVCCCISDYSSYLPMDSKYRGDRASFYGVYDGHSGKLAALYLKDQLARMLGEHKLFDTDIEKALVDTFRAIDASFLNKARAEGLYDGSTASVVLILGNKIVTANVGDSKAVLSVNGIAMDITKDQTPGETRERKRIEANGGWVTEERELQMCRLHQMDLEDPAIREKAEKVVKWVTIYRVNGELAVSRSIGDQDYKGEGLKKYLWLFPKGHDETFNGDLVIPDPEIFEVEITDRTEFFILACDGLWDAIDSQQAVDFVSEKLKEGVSLHEASKALANLALRYGSSDNISVVVGAV